MLIDLKWDETVVESEETYFSTVRSGVFRDQFKQHYVINEKKCALNAELLNFKRSFKKN